MVANLQTSDNTVSKSSSDVTREINKEGGQIEGMPSTPVEEQRIQSVESDKSSTSSIESSRSVLLGYPNNSSYLFRIPQYTLITMTMFYCRTPSLVKKPAKT